MYKAIIVDDETHCIDRLQTLLLTHFAKTIQVAAAYKSVPDALAGIKLHQPHLVFLDVQIGPQTGFDFLSQYGPPHFDIIFTTAYEQYAVKAFQFAALHYLLKPIEAHALGEALNRWQAKEGRQADLHQQVEALHHNLKNLQAAHKRIAIPTQQGLLFVQVNDIMYCQGVGNYTHIFLNNKQRLIVAKTLKEYEQLLEASRFFRIHNSHLINLAYIKMYSRGKGGSVTMTDGTEWEVSVRRKEEFMKAIMA